MDRSGEKTKPSKRSREDRDRETINDHHDRDHKNRNRDREERHKDHHRSERSSKRDKSPDGENRRESRKHESEEHRDHRSSRRKDREGSRDREKSYERDDREGSRDRVSDRKSERDTKRERNLDTESRKKRKDRGNSEDRGDGDEKRARVVDEKRERRRFEDRGKKEVDEGFEHARVEDGNELEVKEEADDDKPEGITTNGGGLIANGIIANPFANKSTAIPETACPHGDSFPTKVYSISTTNENKGVSIRSDEVPGKSSTDMPSAAVGNNGSLSLDALTKARKTLQMQKEMKERLKKLPMLNNVTSSSADGNLGSKEATKPFAPTTGIVQRSSSLSIHSSGALSNSSTVPAPGVPSVADLNTVTNMEAVKRAQELAAKMGFRQDPEFAPLINMFPGQLPTSIPALPEKPTKAPVLRVDAFGREIDEEGNVISAAKPSNLSTLKVNINKKKKDAFQILKPELEVDPVEHPHFDERMGINKAKILRPKRMTFQFVEEGKWSRDAELIKLKSQFGDERSRELKAKQAQYAKAKAAPDINPNLIEVAERVLTKEIAKELVPEIEWWDVPLMANGVYGDIIDETSIKDKLKIEKITIYIEHPRPIDPPAEAAPPPPQPLKLTKREQKKLRTQRRLAREKDRQEMIRQGLVEPPKPKVKMSNLMRVLGSEATLDPTKLEMEIRAAAAEREQAHVDRNLSRKLTPAERREKKERKLFEDSTTLETIVSVYKINDLSHPKTRFKVDVNAQENRLSGCAVISEGISVVVVEGGSKSIKRYGKLMLRRINWAEAVKEEEEEDGDEEDAKGVNKCVLVWQGSVAKPSFYRFSFHECITEAAGRKVFADAGVSHYWDLAVNFSDEI